MLSIPVRVRSMRWIFLFFFFFVIIGHGVEGELQLGSQHIPHHSLGLVDQPKLFSHTQIDGKRRQGLSLVAIQQLSFSYSMQNQGIFFPGHGGHPVLLHTDKGLFIPIKRQGVVLFIHEVNHDCVVHFLHYSFPKQAARRHRLFQTHDFFQFHNVLLGLEADPLILSTSR